MKATSILLACLLSGAVCVAGYSELHSQTFTIRANSGLFGAQDNPGSLDGQKSELHFIAGTSGSWEFPFGKLLAIGLDLEGWWTFREYATTIPAPPLGTVDDYMMLDTKAAFIGARVAAILGSGIRIYCAGAIGYFMSKIEATGTLMGIPVLVKEESKASSGYQVGGGLELGPKNWVLSLDYRYWVNRNSFPGFGAADVGLGGHILSVGLGYSIGR